MNKRAAGNNILVLPGDGIGPEIIEEALKFLNKVSEVFRVGFDFTEALFGGAAIDEVGAPVRIFFCSGMGNLVSKRMRMV